uniref:Uncharacterized protein n=1 Tax=Parascaris univalens TaxID=6257 RepID=A0A915CBW0_PARUN
EPEPVDCCTKTLSMYSSKVRIFVKLQIIVSVGRVSKLLRRPGIGPGPPAWEASILPLNHRRLFCSPHSGGPSLRHVFRDRTRGLLHQNTYHVFFESEDFCQTSDHGLCWPGFKVVASAGNRTRAARVGFDGSSTESQTHVNVNC